MGVVAKICGLKGLLLGLHETGVDRDPIAQFHRWYGFATKVLVPMSNACALATSTREGRPSARMVLLKSADARGFVFFTNYESRKGGELESNPFAALVLHWPELFRQVRVEGRVERVAPEESDAYFGSRLRGSRIGAWASKQSSVIADREQLERRVSEFERKFAGDIPRPEYWGGFRLVPERIEFWQGRPSRLHDRILYSRDAEAWKISRLSP